MEWITKALFIYTIDTSHLVFGPNGSTATLYKSVGINKVQRAVFLSPNFPNLLDISSGGTLYQYDFATGIITTLGSFPNGANIAGMTYNNNVLYGVQYSGGSGNIDVITTLVQASSTLQFNRIALLPEQTAMPVFFFGASTLYVSNGNSGLIRTLVRL